jgi:hypothetical protein
MESLKQATSTIPVVMAAADDPVNNGFVQRPRAPVRTRFARDRPELVVTAGPTGKECLHSRSRAPVRQLRLKMSPALASASGPSGVHRIGDRVDADAGEVAGVAIAWFARDAVRCVAASWLSAGSDQTSAADPASTAAAIAHSTDVGVWRGAGRRSEISLKSFMTCLRGG